MDCFLYVNLLFLTSIHAFPVSDRSPSRKKSYLSSLRVLQRNRDGIVPFQPLVVAPEGDVGLICSASPGIIVPTRSVWKVFSVRQIQLQHCSPNIIFFSTQHQEELKLRRGLTCGRNQAGGCPAEWFSSGGTWRVLGRFRQAGSPCSSSPSPWWTSAARWGHCARSPRSRCRTTTTENLRKLGVSDFNNGRAVKPLSGMGAAWTIQFLCVI